MSLASGRPAERTKGQPGTPLEAAIWALEAGLWPVLIHPYDSKGPSPGKRPIGNRWGIDRPTEASIRAGFKLHPRANIGLKLGADAGIFDIDVDQPEHAGPTIKRLFPNGIPPTPRWQNNGEKFHAIFRYNARLVGVGKTIVKGMVKPDGEVIGNPHYLGLEIRMGAAPGDSRQLQTVIPPSLMTNGAPRRWVQWGEILELPESVVEDLLRNGVEPSTPAASPTSTRVDPPSGDSRWTPEARAVAYLKKCEPAVQGEYGHNKAFKTACKVGPGFDLQPTVALDLLMKFWNDTCQPPWSTQEMKHKVDEAYKVEKRRGWLLNATGASAPQRERLRPTDGHAARKPFNVVGADDDEPPSADGPPPNEQPLAPNEAHDDPHRLARIYLDQRCSHPDRSTLVYQMGEYHRWDNAYRPMLEKDVRAEVGTVVKAEFNRINIKALATHAQKKTEPVGAGYDTGKKDGPPKVAKVTNGLVNNIVLALSGYALVDSRIESPSWLGEGGPWPAREILPVGNGLLHLPSFVDGKPALLKPTPTFFCPYAIDYDFDAKAPTPETWFAFLQQLWADDPQSICTLQEWFGYHLTPDTKQQKIGVIIGPKRSGKGTITRVLTSMIGQVNVCNPTLSALGVHFGSAVLIGKLAAIITDARLSGRSDIAQVVENLLTISGEDGKTISRKHLPDWTGRLAAKFTIVSNEIPRLADSSGALAGRMIMFKLTKSFYGNEDTRLFERLVPELPGILLWAIQGWKRLSERGHFIQPESGSPLVEEMEELASPIGTFVKDCCEIGAGRHIDVDTLFNAWKAWCLRMNRDHVGDQSAFGRNLRTVIPALITKPVKRGGEYYRVFEGLDLRVSSF